MLSSGIVERQSGLFAVWGEKIWGGDFATSVSEKKQEFLLPSLQQGYSFVEILDG